MVTHNLMESQAPAEPVGFDAGSGSSSSLAVSHLAVTWLEKLLLGLHVYQYLCNFWYLGQNLVLDLMRKSVPHSDRQTAIDYNVQINIVSEPNFPDEALLEPKHARYRRRHFPNVALNIRGRGCIHDFGQRKAHLAKGVEEDDQ